MKLVLQSIFLAVALAQLPSCSTVCPTLDPTLSSTTACSYNSATSAIIPSCSYCGNMTSCDGAVVFACGVFDPTMPIMKKCFVPPLAIASSTGVTVNGVGMIDITAASNQFWSDSNLIPTGWIETTCTPCPTVPVTGTVVCPMIAMVACPSGVTPSYIIDASGCRIPYCPPVVCPLIFCLADVYCPQGVALDANGCETCGCAPLQCYGSGVLTSGSVTGVVVSDPNIVPLPPTAVIGPTNTMMPPSTIMPPVTETIPAVCVGWQYLNSACVEVLSCTYSGILFATQFECEQYCGGGSTGSCQLGYISKTVTDSNGFSYDTCVSCYDLSDTECGLYSECSITTGSTCDGSVYSYCVPAVTCPSSGMTTFPTTFPIYFTSVIGPLPPVTTMMSDPIPSTYGFCAVPQPVLYVPGNPGTATMTATVGTGTVSGGVYTGVASPAGLRRRQGTALSTATTVVPPTGVTGVAVDFVTPLEPIFFDYMCSPPPFFMPLEPSPISFGPVTVGSVDTIIGQSYSTSVISNALFDPTWSSGCGCGCPAQTFWQGTDCNVCNCFGSSGSVCTTLACPVMATTINIVVNCDGALCSPDFSVLADIKAELAAECMCNVELQSTCGDSFCTVTAVFDGATTQDSTTLGATVAEKFGAGYSAPCTPGADGCQCKTDNTCDTGLTCGDISRVCGSASSLVLSFLMLIAF